MRTITTQPSDIALEVPGESDESEITRLSDMTEPLWADLAPRLADPVKVWETRTTRQVEFLGQVVFMVDYRRQRVMLFHKIGGRLRPLHDLFDLYRPVKLWVWLEDFVARSRPHPYWFNDVEADLKGRVRALTDLRALAVKVRESLAIEDHPARALALRSRTRTRPGNSSLMAHDFNLVWQHLEAFRLVERENAHLLPLLKLALEDQRFTLAGDPVSAVKQYLVARGLSQAGWRLLVAMGYRGLAPALARFRTKDVLPIVVHYTNALAKAGTRQEPSRAFMRVWLQSIERGTEIRKDWHGHPSHVLRTALASLAQCQTPEAVRQFTLEFLLVDQWVLSKPAFDANRKKMPWAGLVERARTWEKLRAIELECQGMTWDGLIPAFTSDGYTVTPLTDAVSLFKEGLRLRHCAFDFLQECLDGRVLLFAVCEEVSGRPVATLACQKSYRHWKVLDARAFANRHATGPLARMARICADQLTTEQVARRQRLIEHLDLCPEAREAPVPFRGRMEWLDDDDWADDRRVATASNPAPDEDDEVPDEPDPMSAVVAQAWGKGAAPAEAWRAVYETMRERFLDFLVYGCLDLQADHVPDPEAMLDFVDPDMADNHFNDLRSGRASLSQDEWDALRTYWIEATLENPDCDQFHTWVVLEIDDSQGRQAYLLGKVGGYSFTLYVFKLTGLFQFRNDAIEAIRREVLPEAFHKPHHDQLEQ